MRLEFSALTLLASAQALSGQHQLAHATVDRAKEIAAGLSDLSSFCLLDWLEGLVASAQGEIPAANALLLSAKAGFQRSGAFGHMASVALDLAILYDSQDRYPEVMSLMAESLPILLALKLDSESTEALALLEKAIKSGERLLEKLMQVRMALQTVLRLPPLLIAPV